MLAFICGLFFGASVTLVIYSLFGYDADISEWAEGYEEGIEDGIRIERLNSKHRIEPIFEEEEVDDAYHDVERSDDC